MANPALLTCTYASLLAQLGVALLRGSQRPSPALLTRTYVDLGPPPGLAPTTDLGASGGI